MATQVSQIYQSILAEQTIKVLTEGRTTRLPHIARVRFAFVDGSFYLIGGAARSDWVLNALKNGKAKVRTHSFMFNVRAREASLEERAQTVRAFTTKYGAGTVRGWYSNPGICLRMTPDAPPYTRGAVKGEGEATTTFAEWSVEHKDYFRGVVEAFDSASEEYDFTIGHNFINTWIRKRSITELLKHVDPDDTLVEVGCGTGAETVEISKHAARIVATDISEKMLDILKLKIKAKRLSESIIPFKVRAAEISQVADFLGERNVNVVYSFNGALNCEPELDKFVTELSSLLVDGGYFVCSIRNSFCLSEAISHAAVLQFDKMTPRKNQPVMVSVGGMDIPAFYYPPKEFAEHFERHFKLKTLIGLPAFLPPAYLSDHYLKFRKVGLPLEKMEEILADHFPFNRFGDQSLFVFQKLASAHRMATAE